MRTILLFLLVGLLCGGCRLVQNPDGTTTVLPGFARTGEQSTGSQNTNNSQLTGESIATPSTANEPITEVPSDRSHAQAVGAFLARQGYRRASAAMHYRSFPPGGRSPCSQRSTESLLRDRGYRRNQRLHAPLHG